MAEMTHDVEAARKDWMSLLATAAPDHLAQLWVELGLDPAYRSLRAPEVGSVMIQGRAGATGSAFNLGEMSVTRCSLELDSGTIGHGYVQGRDKAHSTIAALIDALMQTDLAIQISTAVLTPLRKAQQHRINTRAAKAAATKVEFFTMVRGEA